MRGLGAGGRRPGTGGAGGAVLVALLLAGFHASALAVATPIAQGLLPLATPGPSRSLSSEVVRVAAEDVPLRVPEGFRVRLFADGLRKPREMLALDDRRVLVVESAADRVRLLADEDGDGRAERSEVWVQGLNSPYGILRRDGFVWIANNDSVVRFMLGANGSAGPREEVIPHLQYDGHRFTRRGHWTRDILFSRDGKQLFVSIGSRSNNDAGEPAGRAAILVHDLEKGRGVRPRLFATGLRNPVSMALRPGSDEIWVSVNERDRLGNELVPDYVTAVRPGGFYGWPYFYIGAHPDPRHRGKRPDLADEVIVPDVLIRSHSAPLGITFAEPGRLPGPYDGALFVGLHGSWNRDPLVGYKVVFVPFRDGEPAGPPRDFLTGFIQNAKTGKVYGRPVAPCFLGDGSLLVSDDGADRIWRIDREDHSVQPETTVPTPP